MVLSLTLVGAFAFAFEAFVSFRVGGCGCVVVVGRAVVVLFFVPIVGIVPLPFIVVPVVRVVICLVVVVGVVVGVVVVFALVVTDVVARRVGIIVVAAMVASVAMMCVDPV